jgi:hypothetical protein
MSIMLAAANLGIGSAHALVAAAPPRPGTSRRQLPQRATRASSSLPWAWARYWLSSLFTVAQLRAVPAASGCGRRH